MKRGILIKTKAHYDPRSSGSLKGYTL